MDLPDEILIPRTQTKNKFCAELLKEHFRDIDYGYISDKRYPRCVNRTSRAGEEIGLLSPSDIFEYKEDNQVYCLTPGDRHEIAELEIPTNPYTGRIIPIKVVEDMKKNLTKRPYFDLHTTLLQLNKNNLCPSYESQNKHVGYTFLSPTDEPYTIELLPQKITVTMFASPIQKYGDIYRVKTDIFLNDKLKTVLYKGDIKEISRVYSTKNDEYTNDISSDDMVEIDPYYKDKLDLLLNNNDETLTDEEWDLLIQADIKGSSNVPLFRGVDFDKKIKNKLVMVGQTVTVNDKLITEWSPNLCVAVREAMHSKHGAVISKVFTPEEVLIDMRYIHSDLPKTVLVNPGQKDVKIETITYFNAPFVTKYPDELIPRTTDEYDIIEKTISVIRSIFL
jgi:hypothetical protein